MPSGESNKPWIFESTESLSADSESQQPETVLESPGPEGLDFLLGNNSRLEGAIVVDFLSDTIDITGSRRVEEAIATDQSLRNEIINLKSTWEYLSLLPQSNLAQKPDVQAAEIIRTELLRQRRWQIAKSLLIMSVSMIFIIAGWIVGSLSGRAYQAGLERFARNFLYYELVIRLQTTDQLNRLVSDDRSAIFERFSPLQSHDLNHQASLFLSKSVQELDFKSIRAEFEKYLAQSPERKQTIDQMVRQIAGMPEETRNLALLRLSGYVIWLDSLTDTEKLTAKGLSEQIRWNRAVNNAQQQIRQAEQAKKPPLSIPELNSPEYVVDLATVTAAWLKMSPQERNNAERRFRNQTKDAVKKNDRIRLLMQTIDRSPPGTFPLLEMMKNAPAPKIASKLNPRKQIREQSRQLYLDSVKAATSSPPGNQELFSFLQSLPPWLAELIEPLPPQEAARFLAVIKDLIEKSGSSNP